MRQRSQSRSACQTGAQVLPARKLHTRILSPTLTCIVERTSTSHLPLADGLNCRTLALLARSRAAARRCPRPLAPPCGDYPHQRPELSTSAQNQTPSRPRALRILQLKSKSGINGPPLRAAPHLFRFGLELGECSAQRQSPYFAFNRLSLVPSLHRLNAKNTPC